MKKGKYSKNTLTLMLVFLALFTIACLFIGFKVQYEPSTLITCVFAFCGAEGGLLAWIKVTKETKTKTKTKKKPLNEEMEE